MTTASNAMTEKKSNREKKMTDVPPRMWVAIKNTDTGIPIDTHPQWSYEDNVTMVVKMAKKHLDEEGWMAVACKLLPDITIVGEIER